MMEKISVVIRARNEIRWVETCLFAIASQDYPQFEIVFVDNESTDGTREIAQDYKCDIIDVPQSEFNYSRALNLGIEKSSGAYVAIVSAHCVPHDDQWLARLAMHFSNSKVAAVYGRQEPTPDSEPADKRDLWITFGMDRRFQQNDFFFHNANSMLRRDLWVKWPFNEEIHGVEDQEWARKLLKYNYQIVYEPTASVFHYHGIHHTQNPQRAARVANIIEQIRNDGR